jgi:hypothetical protein
MRQHHEYRNVAIATPDADDHQPEALRIEGEYRDPTVSGTYRVHGSDEVHELKPHWTRFVARVDLLRIDWACEYEDAIDRIWDLQDGYGVPGYEPPQGWDWSGIRDSSPEAIAQMDAVASEFVSDDDMAKALGLPAGILTTSVPS